MQLDLNKGPLSSLYLQENAFGEVHHNLIPEILRYCHIPDHIQELIISLYSNFQTSVITNSFQTPFIRVGLVELQGELPKPFNFQIFALTRLFITSPTRNSSSLVSQLTLYPVHWFQFADDASVITGLGNENQILLSLSLDGVLARI